MILQRLKTLSTLARSLSFPSVVIDIFKQNFVHISKLILAEWLAGSLYNEAWLIVINFSEFFN